MESDEGKCAPATENERQIWASMDGTKTEEESGMSFASGALYFPNGSSPFPGQRGWLKRESQPGAIVAAVTPTFSTSHKVAHYSPTIVTLLLSFEPPISPSNVSFFHFNEEEEEEEEEEEATKPDWKRMFIGTLVVAA
ncbi:hypothetical protein K0M31_016682 [Melipona bicolor]|uniref:Uncharacterized protein n=1 Tax=Melipona bicolor TaxID=60889 RepID=A0AA40FEG7_9HYME|nr:hypothetical protein K0M31_016682 [Melipona bicolor]